MFEAPRKDQQAWFISHVGADVNLSNVAPREAIGARGAAARAPGRHDARPRSCGASRVRS